MGTYDDQGRPTPNPIPRPLKRPPSRTMSSTGGHCRSQATCWEADMKIQNSSVSLDSESFAATRKTVQESVRVRNDRGEVMQIDRTVDELSISASVESQLALMDALKRGEVPDDATVQALSDDGVHGLGDDITDARSPEELEHLVTRMVLEKTFGRRIELYDVRELEGKAMRVPEGPPEGGGEQTADPAASEGAPQGEAAGAGLVYRRHSREISEQAVHFSASGTVTTGDGRKIAFDLALAMARSSVSEEHVSVEIGDTRGLVDPLVLNPSGDSARLGTEKVDFDLDADGELDEIAQLEAGARFLALDANDNGRIDDGSELFGPQTGNGFLELARLDDDGNHWIDENDAGFHRLKLVALGPNGAQSSIGLADAGVGAIHLGNARTQFQLDDASGSRAGQVARTGVYLTEDGRASTIQHVDFVVE